MKTRAYLVSATIVFVAAVTGGDIAARVLIAKVPFSSAVQEHLHWATLTVSGLVMLLAPYLAVAVLCGWLNRRARSRSVITLFALAMTALAYFYVDAFHASRQAMLEERWTAAALTIGLLPFFIGVPLMLVAAAIACLIVRLDSRDLPDS